MNWYLIIGVLVAFACAVTIMRRLDDILMVEKDSLAVKERNLEMLTKIERDLAKIEVHTDRLGR